MGLVDLKPDELLQVVGGANVDPDRLGLLATANNLSKAAGLPPEALYALFRQGYPASLAALAAQPADAVRQALQQAVTDNVVPGVLGAQIDKFVALLPKLAASKTFLDPTPGAKSLAPLMQLTKLQPAQQVEVLSLFAAAQVPLDQLWQQLRARTDLNSAGQIDQLQLTLQLGTIAQNHAPMVQALQQTPIKSVRDLVGLTADDWLKLTKTQIAGKVVGVPPGVPGKDADAKALNYARTAAAIVELAFPTPVLADRISKDAAFPLKNRSGVVQFFQKNPDFELSTDQIDALLKQVAQEILHVGFQDRAVAPHLHPRRGDHVRPGVILAGVQHALGAFDEAFRRSVVPGQAGGRVRVEAAAQQLPIALVARMGPVRPHLADVDLVERGERAGVVHLRPPFARSRAAVRSRPRRASSYRGRSPRHSARAPLRR